MSTTNKATDSTAPARRPHPTCGPEHQVPLILTRIKGGDAEAAADAMRVAAVLRVNAELIIHEPTDMRHGELESGRLLGLAEDLFESVALMVSDDARAIAAKAAVLLSWLEDGEPPYAAELFQTLAEGSRRLAAKAAQHG